MPLDLEELVFTAGEQDSPPPLPSDGIPRQRIPAFIRWPVRAAILPFILMDVAMQKFARVLIRPPFRQEGTCKKRGNCCYYIMIRKPKGLIGWFFHVWNTQFNGFYLRTKEIHEYENHRVQIMGCRYLQKDGSCKHYALRPMVCRKWPVIEHFGMPRMLKGCGFQAVPRKKASAENPLNILDD